MGKREGWGVERVSGGVGRKGVGVKRKAVLEYEMSKGL